MTLETFFEKFDQFADAPDAVVKMRELILDFAIGGSLLRTSESAEFEVHGEWPRNNLGSIASLITKGSTPTSYGHQYQASGIPFVKVENIADGVINRSSMEQFISEETHEFLKRSQLEDGDILFSIAGTIGKTCVVRAGDIPANTNQALAIIRGFGASFEVPFLKMQLDSFVANKVKAKARGGAMPNVSLGDLRNLLVVVPPLAEQKRIVAKVDELMALCDRLEALQLEREAQAGQLARASLARFADAPTPANLNLLFHSSFPISPSDLRKSILTLAVQGKLVPQDPNDEPAASLISQIAEEKRRLVAARVIRDKEEAPPITDDELPFEAPHGWEWTRLSSITRRIHYGYTASAKSELKDVRLLRITDIQNNFVDWPSVPGCEIAKDEVAQYQLERSDILVARTGGTVGKTYLVQEVPVVAVFASYLIRIQGGTALFDRYLKLFLESPTYWVQLEEGARGAAQPNVNGQTLGRMVIPLPPLAEQRRIVAKVSELMALVDELETQLAASRAAAEKLLSALVAELTGTTSRLPADS
jgi:type I restriction enzyme S subunit